MHWRSSHVAVSVEPALFLLIYMIPSTASVHAEMCRAYSIAAIV